MVAQRLNQPLRVIWPMGKMMRFLGGWFIVGGAVFVLGALRNAGEDGRLVLLLAGGVLALGIGLPVLTFRRGCDFNRGEVVKWWGFAVPWRRVRYALGDFEQVVLCSETRRASTNGGRGQRSYVVYPVRLQGAERIVLRESTDYRVARLQAEEVAQYLDLPLADSTSGEVVVRAAGDLDKSLAEQLQDDGAEIELPDLPPETNLQVKAQGGEVRIELPGRSGLGRSILLWGPGVGLALFGAIVSWQMKLEDLQGAVLMLGLIALSLLLWGRRALERTVVEVDKNRLEVVQRALWTRRRSIERTELEELYQVYKPFALGRGADQSLKERQAMEKKTPERAFDLLDEYGLSCRYILAISDRTRIAIPVYSTAADAQFVHDVIQYGLGR